MTLFEPVEAPLFGPTPVMMGRSKVKAEVIDAKTNESVVPTNVPSVISDDCRDNIAVSDRQVDASPEVNPTRASTEASDLGKKALPRIVTELAPVEGPFAPGTSIVILGAS